jgi:hypothetical protein
VSMWWPAGPTPDYGSGFPPGEACDTGGDEAHGRAPRASSGPDQSFRHIQTLGISRSNPAFR